MCEEILRSDFDEGLKKTHRRKRTQQKCLDMIAVF